MITTDTVKENPCSPSPCGPNSICREINGQPVCSCVAGYLGAPPTCRPECIVSTDCPLSEACSNQKCVNPCPGSCGFRSLCNVVNHNPICNCPSDLTGDPFVQCIPRRKIDSCHLISSKSFLTFLTNLMEYNSYIFSTRARNATKPMRTLSVRTQFSV